MSTNASIESIAVSDRRASSTVWLWWKETRQLLPLAALLAIVAVLVVVLNSVINDLLGLRRLALPNQMMMLVFPGLFATGAGPLLVGQERASRTLDWLVLLPISAKRLVTTKLMVALLGLALMWLFAGTMIALLGGSGQGRFGGPSLYPTTINYSSGATFGYFVWVTHSVFVLVGGFLVSWWIRNQFYSLVALIPIAFTPLLLTSAYAAISGQTFDSEEVDSWTLLFTLSGVVIATPLMFLIAIRMLSPAAAPTGIPVVHRPERQLGSRVSATAPRFGTRIAPLVWQSLMAGAGTWCILGGMMAISGFALLALNASSEVGAAFTAFLGPFGGAVPLLGLALVATSWLGVNVFKHDGSVERIRFLADRGVSPGIVYLGRHALPFAAVSTGLLLYGYWVYSRLSTEPLSIELPSLLSLTVFALVLYGVSQWVSQVVRTLILSVLLAPVISIAVVAWLAFSYSMIGTPIWVLFAVALVPFIATGCMMRRYMDTRDRPITFIVACLVIVTIIGLPVAHATYRVATVPRMTASQRTALLAEGERAFRNANAIQLVFSRGLPPQYGDDGRIRSPIKQMALSVEEYAESPEAWVPRLDELRQDPTLGAMCEPYFVSQWYSRVTMAKSKWLAAAEPDQDAAFETFGHWLESTSVLLPAFRRSVRLIDQNNADALESMLIELLQSDAMKDKLEDPDVQAAIASLGTPNGLRADARRKATLASWHGILTGRSLRSFSPAIIHEVPKGLALWLEPRYREVFVLAALDGIEASRTSNNDDDWRRRLHDLQQPKGVFEESRYGDAMRMLPVSITRFQDGGGEYGELWGRAWEYTEWETNR